MRLPRTAVAACLLVACGGDGDSSGPSDGRRPDGNTSTIDAPKAPPDADLSCTPVEGTPTLTTQDVVTSGLVMPVYVTSPPGDARLFVLEKQGRVRVIKNGQLLEEPFLTVPTQTGGLSDERGLLSIAFAPDYAQSRKVYVFYTAETDDTNDNDEVVEMYLADPANPDRALPDSGQLVIRVEDFAGNHNGGTLAFRGDYLYWSVGDGGGGGDPNETGQDLDEPLGKIHRLDVSTLPATAAAGNPFIGDTAGLDTIWSYGWRNPWRFSFDRETGDMYVGDVGQDTYEEVDVEAANDAGGKNYGWDQREGKHCHEPLSGCTTAGMTEPVFEYAQNGQIGGCTVVGGYVYRGCAMPGYHGTYFFADYCGGWVRSFKWDGGGGVTDVTVHEGLGGSSRVSFGQDAAGEIYLVEEESGDILKIVPE
jgi:glucose/arabinose dehydrogenase